MTAHAYVSWLRFLDDKFWNKLWDAMRSLHSVTDVVLSQHIKSVIWHTQVIITHKHLDVHLICQGLVNVEQFGSILKVLSLLLTRYLLLVAEFVIISICLSLE